MNKKMSKTITLLSSLPVVLSFSVASVQAGYLTSAGGSVSTNAYKQCWSAKGGTTSKHEMCGDMIEKMAPKVMAPAKMEKKMVADSDGDGVLDDKDLCLGTPAGAKVDAQGCEIIENITINLNADEFAFDSDVLTADMKKALFSVANKVKASKGNEQLNIVGHTDNFGSDEYNNELSVRRAKAVAAYLERKGVSAGSMSTSGMGESSPAASNDTEEGRAQNRRVVINTK